MMKCLGSQATWRVQKVPLTRSLWPVRHHQKGWHCLLHAGLAKVLEVRRKEPAEHLQARPAATSQWFQSGRMPNHPRQASDCAPE
jgi:hypothetical protein